MSRQPESQEPAQRSAPPHSADRDFLLALAAGVQKFGIYPPGHPMLQGVAAKLHTSVEGAIAADGLLAIGPARDHILMGDSVVPADVPLLRDLARRAVAHQIGAITFHSGVLVSEVERLLAALAAEPSPDAPSLAGVIAIRIRALDYDRIGLGEETDLVETESPGALWDALARTALLGAPPAGADEPRDLARAVATRHNDSAFVSVVAVHLARIVHALRGTDSSPDAVRTRVRVSELIRLLDAETLRSLVRLDGDALRRAEMLRAAATAVAPDALVRLITAAADASSSSVSHGVLRLLAKLASVSRAPVADVSASARAELRRTMDRLLSDWTLENPNPEMYGHVLDTLAFGSMATDGSVAAKPVGVERVLEISQEVGSWGPAAERVAQTLMDQGDVRQLLEIVRSSNGDAATRRQLEAVVYTPRLIYLMTATDEVDREALLEVAKAMGDAAVDPLLDALADSPSRNVRRCAFDCLTQLGPAAAHKAIERANDPRWFVTRNMLALAAAVPLPERFDVLHFLDNEDPRVRAQAVAVARQTGNPAPALARALTDADPRVVTAALRGLDTVAPVLVDPLRRVAERDAETENRTLAVRALGVCPDDAACEALIALSGAGRSWLGRLKIKRVTPVAVEALRALAIAWGDRPAVRAVLDAALRSRDADVRRAGEGM